MPFSVRVSGVSYSSNAATPQLFDGGAHVSQMDDGLREFP
jgi:hypothetical protein